MPSWKKSTLNTPGSSTIIGAADFNKISAFLNGEADIDAADINSDLNVRNGKLKIRNPANTFGYTISAAAISADRVLGLPPLINDDTIATLAHAQAFLNKTIDAHTTTGNKFDHILVSHFNQRWGMVHPVSGGYAAIGVLANMTSTGTVSSGIDATQGLYTAWTTTTSGAYYGLTPTTATSAGVSRRGFNPKLHLTCKNTNTTESRMYLGFTSAQTLPLSDTPLASGDSGVMIGWRTTDANISVFNNDGTGGMVVTSTGVAKDTAWHEFKITMTPTDVTVVLDDGATIKTQTLTTRIPGLTTNLFVDIAAESTGTTSKAFQLDKTWLRSDK